MTHVRPAVLAVLLSLSAHAAEVDGSLRAWVGTGLDTNPHRDFVQPGDRTVVDAFLQGLLQLDGALRFERGALGAGYDLGARKFMTTGLWGSPNPSAPPYEDMLVQTGSLSGELFLSPQVSLGATGQLRDRRGSSRWTGLADPAGRNYTDLSGEAFARLIAGGRLDARLRVGVQRFLYWTQLDNDDTDFRGDCCFYGPTLGAHARFRLTPRHAIAVSLDYEPRTFDVAPFANPDLAPPPALPAQRSDNVLLVSASYQYRGPWAFGASFAFLESSSNSYARSLRRYSFAMNAGVRLFWKLSLMGNAALHIVDYPDGLYLPPFGTSEQDGVLTYDADETGPHFSLRLSRPLGDWFEVDFRYQLFFANLITGRPSQSPDPNQPNLDALTYQRHAFTVGFSFRLGAN